MGIVCPVRAAVKVHRACNRESRTAASPLRFHRTRHSGCFVHMISQRQIIAAYELSANRAPLPANTYLSSLPLSWNDSRERGSSANETIAPKNTLSFFLSFSSYKVRVPAVTRLRPSREIRLASPIRSCSPRVINSIRSRIPRDRQSIEQL